MVLGRKVAFRTLGCKQNQFDTEGWRRRLRADGFIEAPCCEEADWLILNTCAVTERASAKARGELSRLRRINPSARIVALGCGVRYRPGDFAAADYMGTVPEEFIWQSCGPDESPTRPHGVIPNGKTRGFLRIQSGCEENCAFCIVPQLRGPSRSLPLVDCLQALQDLLNEGAPEIVLTGTNIALWGRDLPGRPQLLDLLKALVSQIGSARLRLSSLEAPLITPALLEWCVNEPRICRHFHFALQSGSPKVLELMRRRDHSARLTHYLKDLAQHRPDVCLGADFIVGLPGETERDYRMTLDFIQSVPLSYLHVFPFSERPGTQAASMPSSVPVPERLRRAALLRELNTELKTAFISRNLKISQEVVGMGKGPAGLGTGLASNYLRLSFRGGLPAGQARFWMRPDDRRVTAVSLQQAI